MVTIRKWKANRGAADAQLFRTLHLAMKTLGTSRRALEHRLRKEADAVPRRLGSGIRSLPVEDACRLSRALGLESWELFQLAFPPGGKPLSAAAAHVRQSLQPDEGDTAPRENQAAAGDLERALSALMERTWARVLARLS